MQTTRRLEIRVEEARDIFCDARDSIKQLEDMYHIDIDIRFTYDYVIVIGSMYRLYLIFISICLDSFRMIWVPIQLYTGRYDCRHMEILVVQRYEYRPGMYLSITHRIHGTGIFAYIYQKQINHSCR